MATPQEASPAAPAPSAQAVGISHLLKKFGASRRWVDGERDLSPPSHMDIKEPLLPVAEIEDGGTSIVEAENSLQVYYGHFAATEVICLWSCNSEDDFNLFRDAQAISGGSSGHPLTGNPISASPTNKAIDEDKREWMRDVQLGNSNNSPSDSTSNIKGKEEQGSPAAARWVREPLLKKRRFWTPELHGSFVDAVEQLGGCQAATPKQILDIMRVDDLTISEVKSRLQKYRLRSRGVPTENQNSTSQPSPLHPLIKGGSSDEEYGDDDEFDDDDDFPDLVLQFGKIEWV